MSGDGLPHCFAERESISAERESISTMRIAIVGAGIAGLACAGALDAGSDEIILFDKGARPGGRLSTSVLSTSAGDASFDYGTRSFSAWDPTFRERIARWLLDGVVARWPAAEDGAWVGVPGMSAPIADMARTLTVRWATRVDAFVRCDGRWRLTGEGLLDEVFDRVAAAVPAEQVGALVKPFDAALAKRAETTRSQPCWSLMAAFAARLPIAADIIESQGSIGSAVRNSSKPGRSGPEAWVIQASAEWSNRYIEADAGAVSTALLAEFARLTRTPLPVPLLTRAHRWRYATSGSSGEGFLWNESIGLGVCGDWLLGPNVEGAWLSGTALGREMRLRRVERSA